MKLTGPDRVNSLRSRVEALGYRMEWDKAGRGGWWRLASLTLSPARGGVSICRSLPEVERWLKRKEAA